MTTDYAYWQSKLDGGDPDPPADRTELPCGFWRLRDSRPLAVWLEDGRRYALVGFKLGTQASPTGPRNMKQAEMERIAEAGGFGQAMPEDVYRRAFDAGFWEDDEPPPLPADRERPIGPGHNVPDDLFEMYRDQLADEENLAASFLAQPIASQAEADKAAAWSRRIGMLAAKLDGAHAEEKRPILDEAKRVDDRWRGVRADARALVDRLKNHVTPWLRKLKREAEEKARAAQLEADRLRREAAEAQSIREKAELIEQAQAADREAEPERVTAGRPNMRVGLRQERSAKIVNFDAALMALKDHPDMRELVQRLANRAIKAGLTLPGVEVELTDVAR